MSWWNYFGEISKVAHADSCREWVKHNKCAKSKRTKPSPKKRKIKRR